MIDAPVSVDPMEKSQCSVVVFSGGQDSTTCLIHALQTESPQTLHCLTFDYGQRHRAEIAVAQTIASTLGITTHLVIEANALNQLSFSSLTHHHLPLPIQIEAGIPNTFVPGRNIIFLMLAMIYAYQVGAYRVITGVCETDFSGYPDCRSAFIQVLNQAVNLGLGRTIAIETPLMALNKAEIWALADAYGQLDLIAQQTLTCYQGLLGSGCGQCPACQLRARGLQQYQADRTGVLTSLKAKIGLL